VVLGYPILKGWRKQKNLAPIWLFLV